MSGADRAVTIIKDIRRELQDAASNILSQTFAGMDLVRHPLTDTAALEAVFIALLEASYFQDVSGQRLDQLEALLTGHVDDRPDSELLNGPAACAEGLDQAAADRLFGDANG